MLQKEHPNNYRKNRKYIHRPVTQAKQLIKLLAPFEDAKSVESVQKLMKILNDPYALATQLQNNASFAVKGIKGTQEFRQNVTNRDRAAKVAEREAAKASREKSRAAKKANREKARAAATENREKASANRREARAAQKGGKVRQ